MVNGVIFITIVSERFLPLMLNALFILQNKPRWQYFCTFYIHGKAFST